MIAVIMQEICMSCGYYCHIIQTKSSNPFYLNSHWGVQVYILNYKLVMLNPAYNTFYKTDKHELKFLLKDLTEKYRTTRIRLQGYNY